MGEMLHCLRGMDAPAFITERVKQTETVCLSLCVSRCLHPFIHWFTLHPFVVPSFTLHSFILHQPKRSRFLNYPVFSSLCKNRVGSTNGVTTYAALGHVPPRVWEIIVHSAAAAS